MFTEEDAQNDGLIKREVGTQMAKVARTHNPEVFEHFVSVCEEVGRAPKDVLGEMAVRSLNSEEYADRIFNSELSMKQLRADEIRIEDVEYVKQLSESLGLNEETETHDPVERLIDQRLQSITQSPIPRLRNEQNAQQTGDSQVMQYMEKLDQKMDNLESQVSNGKRKQQEGNKEDEDGGKSIDDLFGGSGNDTEQEGGNRGTEEVEGNGAEVVEENEEISDEAIEEAMEGVGDVDDVSDTEPEVDDDPFGGEASDVEVVNKGESGDGQTAGPVFDSSNAEEEE